MYANADKFHYATAEAEAMKILAELKALPGCAHASTCGTIEKKRDYTG